MSALSVDIALAVVGGGMLGALARFALARALPANPGRASQGILLANVIASGAAGVLLALAPTLDVAWLAFWLAGVCGSLSTFATWALETVRLAESGARNAALSNVAVTILGCLLAASVGFAAVSLAV